MKKRWLVLPGILLVVALSALAVKLTLDSSSANPAAAAQPGPVSPTGVGCRGRIEPEDGVMFVAAPYFAGRPSLIRELRVKQGDWLKSGQIIAILDGWNSLEKALRQSEADVEVARTRLAQVRAGTKQADIDAQKMDVLRWESEYEIADTDLRRATTLKDNGILASSDLDQKRLVLDRARRTLDGARERLKSLEEVRKVDVDVLAAQVTEAESQVEHAKAELEQLTVRAPVEGRVLKIHAHEGEEPGPHGILEMGKTNHMYVIGEVYETDIGRVRLGQKAIISGAVLPDKLTGSVSQIEPQVSKSELLPSDPAAFSDTRIVKVKIRLDDSERAAGLIYGKVDVVIQP